MFVNDFYKCNEHNYEGFFSGYSDNAALKAAKSDMKAAAKVLEEKSNVYLSELEKRYNINFTPVSTNYILRYTDRKSYSYYYDGVTGNRCNSGNPETTDTYVTLPTKNDSIAVVVGYCFELGAVVVRQYNYHVATDNSKTNLVFTHEYLIPLIESDADVSGYTLNASEIKMFAMTKDKALNYYHPQIQTALQRANASEFINAFYGIERVVNFSLYQMNEYLFNNKSFEILIRTVEDKETLSVLLPMHSDEAVPVYKLIGTDKAAWKYAETHNCCKDFINFKKKFPSRNSDRRAKRFNEVFHKSDIEWIDFMEKTKHWKEDLVFYGFNERDLPETLIEAFAGLEYPYEGSNFPKYYSFNKFCSYVVEESINQGYTSLSNFMRTLADYIRMCEDLEVVPTLFSSYLSQTHDIVNRNHKISISPTQEKTFKERYSKFKKFSTEDSVYSVVAPSCSFDLRREGDELNHCVASYIKRVIDGDCLILFLRLAKSLAKSLVTIEVRNKMIVQARGLHNRDIDDNEKIALRQFCKDRGLTLRV